MSRSAPDKYDEELKKLLQVLHPINLNDSIYDQSAQLEGNGGYSDVFKAKSSKHGGVEVAVKRLRIHILNQKKVSKAILRELSVWYKLNHPNILPLLGYVMNGKYPALVSKWMKKGSLRGYIEAHPDLPKILMVTGIAAGLTYLHNQNVVHSDLKGENILISDMGQPLLADFGISRVMNAGGISSSDSITGTVNWLAVELVDYKMRTENGEVYKYSKQSDIWAFGMVLYELLSGRIPFDELSNNFHICSAISGDKLPSTPTLSNNADLILWDICRRCWTKKPNYRPDATWIYYTFSEISRNRNLRTLDLLDQSCPTAGMPEESVCLSFVAKASADAKLCPQSDCWRYRSNFGGCLCAACAIQLSNNIVMPKSRMAEPPRIALTSQSHPGPSAELFERVQYCYFRTSLICQLTRQMRRLALKIRSTTSMITFLVR
ncbi:kinase-like protein [Schizopora paradoxa]|uniref:Kinase-like protein n=1 Tax=Schizopora paradoxa TaxID=27342 RepID=A0A0H2RQK0_9AGAM|nr:kinase-like protein [Schizopora paradoxa]